MNCNNTKNLQSLLGNIGVATMIFNADAVVTACNSASEKLLGLPDGGLVGCTLAELELFFVDADGNVDTKDGFPVNRLATDQKEATHFDIGLQLSLPGQNKWFRATLQPNFATGDEFASLVLSLAEITDLVAEQTVQNQIFLAKNEWETTVDALQDVVTILDLDMRIVRANKVAHDFFGHRLGELNGKKCHEVFHNKKFPCGECPIRETANDHCSHIGTIHNKILDRTFQISSFPIFDQQGKLHQFIHVARDVTEPLRDESENNRLKAVIEQTSVSVVISNCKGEIEYVNPTFEATTGYSRDEAIGRNLNILKSGEHDRQFYVSMRETLLNKKVWRGRLTNRRKDGTLFREDATISSVLDSSGGVINYVALKRDITREELLEQQLHQGMKMEALGTLAGGIAHNFNNILAAMIGYGEIAQGRLPPEHPARKDLDQVIAGGDRATAEARSSGKVYMIHPDENGCVFLEHRNDKYYCKLYNYRPKTCRGFRCNLADDSFLQLFGGDSAIHLLGQDTYGLPLK